MFLTNPYIALRGISVPLDLAFPGKPAVSPERRAGTGAACAATPLIPAGAGAVLVLNPPCPALPALLLEWLCPLPWGCSHSGEGSSSRGAACLCPAAAPPGLGGPGWAEPALLPACSRSCSPGCSQMGQQSLGLMQHSVPSGFIHEKNLFLVLDRDYFCGKKFR